MNTKFRKIVRRVLASLLNSILVFFGFLVIIALVVELFPSLNKQWHWQEVHQQHGIPISGKAVDAFLTIEDRAFSLSWSKVDVTFRDELSAAKWRSQPPHSWTIPNHGEFPFRFPDPHSRKFLWRGLRAESDWYHVDSQLFGFSQFDARYRVVVPGWMIAAVGGSILLAYLFNQYRGRRGYNFGFPLLPGGAGKKRTLFAGKAGERVKDKENKTGHAGGN